MVGQANQSLLKECPFSDQKPNHPMQMLTIRPLSRSCTRGKVALPGLQSLRHYSVPTAGTSTKQANLVQDQQQDQQQTAKPFKSIPSVNELRGQVGLIRELSQGLLSDLFKRWSADFGNSPIFRFKPPFNPEMVVLLDPRDYETVFRRTMTDGNIPFRTVNETWLMYRKARQLPIGLTMERDQKWLEIRNAANQIMLPKMVSSALDRINACCIDVLPVIDASLDDEGHLSNIHQVGFFFGLETIVSVLLGQRLGVLDPAAWAPGTKAPAIQNAAGQQMVDGVTTMFETSQELSKLPLYRALGTLSPTLRKHYKAWDDMIESGRAIRKNLLQNTDGNTLMDYIQATENLQGDDFDIMGVELIAGGVDTLGTTLTWMLYHLAANPEKQEMLYRELLSVVGSDPNTPITKEHLKKLKYLKYCLKESFRLTPTVSLHTRNIPMDLTLAGHNVPAGSQVIMANYVSSHSEKEYGPTVEEFIPERHEKSTAHPYSSLPFGMGSRRCVGQRVAETEAKVMAAKIVQKYKLSYIHGPKGLPAMKESTLIVPKISDEKREWIKFEKRE